MKILLVSEFYWPNLDGAALFERRLAQAMAQRGHEIVVWAPAQRLHSYVEDDGGLRTYREASLPLLNKPLYRVSVWPFRHAFGIMRHERPDVVHIHNSTQIGLAALLAARRCGCPVVATNHAMPQNVLGSNLPQGLHRQLTRAIWHYIVWFHNRANYVTTPTPIALSYLKQRGLRRPAQAITNGLDLDWFQPGRSKQPPPPRLLYLGRLDKEKNVAVLLRAAALLKPQVAFGVDIIGGGTQERQLKALARQLGVESIVHFHGKVSESTKLQLLQATTVFVMPSPAELQSIATMEAMACAKPVVAADAGALPNLITDGTNGYLFPYRDAAALAERCLQLLQSPKLQQRFGHANLDKIHHHHTAETCYRQYEESYRQVISQPETLEP